MEWVIIIVIILSVVIVGNYFRQLEKRQEKHFQILEDLLSRIKQIQEEQEKRRKIST